MEKVELEVQGWSWHCPVCGDYNYISNSDLWDDTESVNVMCGSCEVEFISNITW